MMAGRLTKEEEELKINALWIAYEKYISEGNDTPSQDMVTEQANEREEIKACNTPIGKKTLASSKNKRIKKLRETMNSKKNKVSELKSLAPTELSTKIEQLHSSLEANAILAQKIENLEKRLRNKDEALEEKEIRITKLSKEIESLRLRQREA
jgi:predicted RNase H-like nuclease (RuvC/YqgF family)